jgi:beta-glucosidase
MPAPQRDLGRLIADLTLEEKATLTAGRNGWSTQPVERVGLPPVRVTDGPNGARGSSVLGIGEASAACVPCGTALGATWDPDLVERVGELLGEEARTKGCRVLLAPTVNLHRSPLAGRNFECFSEDPLLSGRMAAAYIRGVQSRAVATTVKHLAGNEAEYERYTMNSVIDERALREIYLLPFEIAVKEGDALGLMTSYNRLNGSWCADDEALLAGLLRGEWGFRGFVVSDWFAFMSTDRSPRAGLDLEMPGPARVYGPALAAAVRAGEVPEELLDAQVTRLLRVFDELGALDDPPEAQEQSIDRPEHRAIAREAASASIVLLRNQGLLPLDPAAIQTLAVVGPNADRAQIMGGGSAKLRPHYRITPLEAIRERFGPGVEIRHERGAGIDRSIPPVAAAQLAGGFALDVFAGTELAGEVVHRLRRPDGILLFTDEVGPGVDADEFSYRARGAYTPAEDGVHVFSLVQAGGHARVLVGGELLLDGMTDPPPRGEAYFGMGSERRAAEVDLRAGEPVEVVVEFASRGAASQFHGAEVGCRAPAPDDLLERAVAAAEGADAALVVVGTNDDWESEGHDRRSMDLPGAQDELVRRVCAVNPNTVVVVNTGSPVTMDWAAEAPAVLQIWFGGQEAAHALADVLTGDAEPAGRLPTTFPERLEHNPSYGNFPGENGEVRYGEGVLVGYRWYEARRLPTRFPFGHGLSYSTFALGEPALSAAAFAPGDTLTVQVPVANTGDRRGAEVVQCYVAPLAPGLVRPPQELKAFAKVWLDPGEQTTVTLELGDRAFAAWDPGDREWPSLRPRFAGSPLVNDDPDRRTRGGWRIEGGAYEIRIGRSSADIAHAVALEVGATD